MKTIGPVDWAVIMWSSIGRGLLAEVVGPKPMVLTYFLNFRLFLLFLK